MMTVSLRTNLSWEPSGSQFRFLIVILKAHKISRKGLEIMHFSYYIAFNLLYAESYANMVNTYDF